MPCSRKHIKPLPIIDYSGFSPKPGCIPFAKKHQYFIVTGISITGDAPKDFIRFYQFKRDSRICKAKPKTWPLFLAKHGHKHYPMEAITEHLLNRIGEIFGFNMAESGLAWFGGQVRFLSKYFLTRPKEQVLDHGADLYAGYLNDREFVEEIEKLHQTSEYFSVQFTQTVFKHFFPDDYETLMLEFIKLLVFDALIGNNDRHFYNWGIIRNIQGKEKPVFSPIYDTARGLFWNDHEDKLKTIYKDKKRLSAFLKKYSDNSSPKIGWDGFKKLSHFDLVENIKTLPIALNCETLKIVCSEVKINEVTSMIDKEFSQLLSNERRELIKICLRYRHDRIKKIFNFEL
ncbi:MAG: HipA domain-containing protein [Bacteroidota bacterium]|nr:HipA domain-containing protein [Bacteroidota bacterium]